MENKKISDPSSQNQSFESYGTLRLGCGLHIAGSGSPPFPPSPCRAWKALTGYSMSVSKHGITGTRLFRGKASVCSGWPAVRAHAHMNYSLRNRNPTRTQKSRPIGPACSSIRYCQPRSCNGSRRESASESPMLSQFNRS